jgi:hypothetical protein
MTVSKERAHEAWRHAEQLKRLSDRLVGIGPFGIGLDTILAWVPVAGTVYSGLAGLLMMGHGFRAQASAATLLRMGAYIVFNTITSDIPLAGQAIDSLFPGHLMAAKALQKDIEAKHGLPPEEAERRQNKRGWFGGKRKKAAGRALIEGELVR